MPAWAIILVGLLLSLVGVILPFLMVIKVLTSTLFLNFLSFTASISGLMLGILGASRYIGAHRK